MGVRLQDDPRRLPGAVRAPDRGVNQIERSEAETGLVVFSFKNRLPHASLMPPARGEDGQEQEDLVVVHENPGVIAVDLAALVDARTEAMGREVTRDENPASPRWKESAPRAGDAHRGVHGARAGYGPLAASLIGFMYLTTLELGDQPSRFTSDVDSVLTRDEQDPPACIELRGVSRPLIFEPSSVTSTDLSRARRSQTHLPRVFTKPTPQSLERLRLGMMVVSVLRRHVENLASPGRHRRTR